MMRFRLSFTRINISTFTLITPLLLVVVTLIGKSHQLAIGGDRNQTFSSTTQVILSTPSSIPSTTKEPASYYNGSVIVNGTFYNDSREARRSVVSGGIFTIISFENVPCIANTAEIGMCYSNRECTNLGGTAAGPCAGNYGVCCVLTASCGSTVSINNTYIVNPGYPSTTTGPLSCTIKINKLTGASQLYLEYQKFMLVGPTNGACTNDSMTIVVTGATTPSTYPVLCGNNTGQMDYIDISSASGPVTITFNLPANSDPRCWKIRVVEFKSTDLCAAPSGCTQYLRDLSGTIESYNFNGGQGQFLDNYCITICFQQHSGYRNLLLTEGSFMLSGIAPSDCVGDYILANGQEFCGETLNNGMLQVNFTTGPIKITVCSDNSNFDLDLGYSLNYNFLPSSTG